ncbi:NLP/P60 family protein [Alcanivorax hongdengensis A-11-3]|uniref:NLP/P60 family protein n=1 Tax=Alcanivorax hongdengensis A-11-3 TaxID=1177179 RepID=L0WER3_9GAMM|nr:NlpC/P60 family protein [Alcanivorax hongdengensis]EKF74647.1 NLP/P60 family protein [Alcanivorax hongdengensis A-11-3]
MRSALAANLLVMLAMAGCATGVQDQPAPPPPPPQALQAQPGAPGGAPVNDVEALSEPADGPQAPSDTPLLEASLQAQLQQWQGVPYRYGGTSEHGVDCSGLVYLTFMDQLGVQVPRTTRELVRTGEPVSRRQLQPGDLVFFRTGPGNRHVGIYMGEGEFLHASSSSGVRVSSLDNHYWRRHYWQARRIRVTPASMVGE